MLEILQRNNRITTIAWSFSKKSFVKFHGKKNMKSQHNVFYPNLCCNEVWYIGTIPGRVAQSVTCLATDACLTADPGVASSIPARYHTFVEIDHEIISTVILLPSADLFKKGCCQLQAKVCAQITG